MSSAEMFMAFCSLESGVLYPVAILVALLIGELVVPNPSLFALLAEVVVCFFSAFFECLE